MNDRLFFIGLLSVISIILLLSSIAYLLYVSPLEQNNYAHQLVIELYNKDPKVERDTVNGTLKISPNQFASDTLRFLDHYIYIPIIALALSLIINLICILLVNNYRNLAGSLLMCAAAFSSFTIIPPILQVISGILLLKDHKTSVNDYNY